MQQYNQKRTGDGPRVLIGRWAEERFQKAGMTANDRVMGVPSRTKPVASSNQDDFKPPTLSNASNKGKRAQLREQKIMEEAKAYVFA